MNFKNDFIIIDIETTGLSANNGDEITEIAAIEVDGNTLEIKNIFTTLVKINSSVPPFITNLTGITNEMLWKQGIKIDYALKKLSNFCKNLECYAHNVSFDKGFIRHYLNKTRTHFIETEWIDTISIFRNAFPGRSTYKLDSLIKDFKLATQEDHRALSDAKHTLSLLKIAKEAK